MTAATHDNFEIRIVVLPRWLLPLAAAAAVALVGLAGLFGFGLLLLVSPLILAAGVVQYLKAFRKPWEQPPPPKRTSYEPPLRPTRSIVIDGDYVVLDEALRPTSKSNGIDPPPQRVPNLM